MGSHGGGGRKPVSQAGGASVRQSFETEGKEPKRGVQWGARAKSKDPGNVSLGARGAGQTLLHCEPRGAFSELEPPFSEDRKLQQPYQGVYLTRGQLSR